MSFMETLKNLIAEEEKGAGVETSEEVPPEEQPHPVVPEKTEQEKNLERIKELEKELEAMKAKTKAPENERGDDPDPEPIPESERLKPSANNPVPPVGVLPISSDIADMILSRGLTPGAMKALTPEKLKELKDMTQDDFYQAVKALNDEYPAPSGRIEEAGKPSGADDEIDWTLSIFE